MAARSIASATISFGLVSIPVKLYTATESQSSISFNQLAPDGSRVKQQYVSSSTGKLVERGEMKKGYEFAKGGYVIIDPKELAAVEAKSTGAVDIEEFVPLTAIDPLYFQKSYFLGPDKGGARAYQLLAQAMRESGFVGIGKYAARGKDYLTLIRPTDDGLILEQLYYADEVRKFADIPIEEAEVKPAELKLAKQLIDQVASKEFRPERYHDTVKARVMELIEKKIAGEDISVEPEQAVAGKVVDLMEALKQSLGGEKKPAKRAERPAKKAASKKAAGKTAASETAADKKGRKSA